MRIFGFNLPFFSEEPPLSEDELRQRVHGVLENVRAEISNPLTTDDIIQLIDKIEGCSSSVEQQKLTKLFHQILSLKELQTTQGVLWIQAFQHFDFSDLLSKNVPLTQEDKILIQMWMKNAIEQNSLNIPSEKTKAALFFLEYFCEQTLSDFLPHKSWIIDFLQQVKLAFYRDQKILMMYEFSSDQAIECQWKDCITNYPIARVLLAMKKDDKQTLFHTACIIGDLDAVKLLLEKGADPNIKNEIGQTAFHLACLEENLDVVKLLLKNGADLEIETIQQKIYPFSSCS